MERLKQLFNQKEDFKIDVTLSKSGLVGTYWVYKEEEQYKLIQIPYGHEVIIPKKYLTLFNYQH